MASNQTSAGEHSLVAGHAQFAKGYVAETVGNITGSEEWKASGQKDIQDGTEEMKAASAENKTEPAPSSLGGKVEQLAGKATGCEGMESEGLERQEKAL